MISGADRCVASGTFSEDVKSRISVMIAQPTAFVLSVRALVSKEHVVSERDRNKISVVWNPRGDTRVIVEKVSNVRRGQTHYRTFFVYVVTM